VREWRERGGRGSLDEKGREGRSVPRQLMLGCATPELAQI